MSTRRQPVVRGREEASGGAAILRWGIAASVVLAAHAAGAWGILQQMPEAPPAGVPQAPILIDLAPPAASPELASLQAESGPEVVDTPEEPPVEQPMEEPVPPPPVETPPEAAEPEPVEPDAAEPELKPELLPDPEAAKGEKPPEPEPAFPDAPAQSETAAVVNAPVPTPRPNRPRVRQAEREEPERPRPETRRAERPEPRRDTRTRQAPPPSAASQGQQKRQASLGAQVSQAAQARWQQQVRARLNRAERNPRGGGAGTAQVTFVVNASGRVLSARLVRSAGDPILDRAAVALVWRASPFPAPPTGQQTSMKVPLRFD